MPLLRRRSSPTAHWSKDFIEHLRAVHFTLIVLAVIAIISGRAPDVLKMRTAQNQLRAIRNMMEEIPQSSSMHDRDVLFRGDEAKLPSRGFLFDRKDQIAFPIPFGIALVRGNCLGGSEKFASVNDILGKAAGDVTLDSFQSLWNTLNCSRVFIETVGFYESVMYRQLPREPTPLSFVTSQQLAHIKKKERMVSLKLGKAGWDAKALEAFVGHHIETPPETILMTFDVVDYDTLQTFGYIVVRMSEAIAYDGHNSLKQRNPAWDCKVDFAHCFVELDDIAIGKGAYSLKNLSQWLEEEVAHSEPGHIDVFGIKFPADSQAQWGIILIVTVLLYFWMHLRELSPRLKAAHSGVEIAWPGLYRSWIAYVVVWGTVVFVPLYALWILGLNRVHYKSPWRTFVASNWRDVGLWLAVPLVLYSVLSVWSCLKLRRLALLADAARQKDENEPVKEEPASSAQAGAE